MCHLIFFVPFLAIPVFWVFPLSTALPFYFSVLAISFFIYFKIFQALCQKVQTGQEAMFGKNVLVIEDIDPEGKILFKNEIWDASAKGKRFEKGDHVLISGIRGLKVMVEAV
jgi:membrane-bound serine protease (ClpP class)